MPWRTATKTTPQRKQTIGVPLLIDVHTHIYLRSYIEALAGRNQVPMVKRAPEGEHLVIFEDEDQRLGGTRAMPESFHSVDEKLAFMRASGISTSIVSLGNPWVDHFHGQEGVALAGQINRELSEMTREDASLEALGVLPVNSPAEAAAEAARIAHDSPLLGVILGTRPMGGHLDDERMDPVWAALEEHELPILLHPHYALGYEWMSGHGHAMPLGLAFPFETATAATRLILGGVLDRYPGLQIVLSHGGGVLPYLVGRLEACISADDVASKRIPPGRDVHGYLSRFYYDVITYRPEPLKLLLDLVGADRCMFGTDHPFGIADPGRVSAAIDEAVPSSEAREAIRAGTAKTWIDTGRLP